MHFWRSLMWQGLTAVRAAPGSRAQTMLVHEGDRSVFQLHASSPASIKDGGDHELASFTSGATRNFVFHGIMCFGYKT